MAPITSLTDIQPHLSVVDTITQETHIVTLKLIRDIASGDTVNDNVSRVIAMAFLQYWEE